MRARLVIVREVRRQGSTQGLFPQDDHVVQGAMAFDEKSNGEKVHGIASAHGAVAIVTAGAYGLAIASVSFKF